MAFKLTIHDKLFCLVLGFSLVGFGCASTPPPISFSTGVASGADTNEITNLDFGPPKFTEDTFSGFEVYELHSDDTTKTTIAVVKPIFQSVELTCNHITDKTPNKLVCSKSTDSVAINVYYDEKQTQIIISKNIFSREINAPISLNENPLLSSSEPGNTTSSQWRQDDLLDTEFIAIRDAILTAFKEHHYSIKKVDKE